MPEVDALPVGRLNKVARPWDYQGGFVRAPLNEIVFNNRLTKQARLLWLWLAAVHPAAQNISWADCEKMMRCATKARRSCLAQLVEEGFVTVEDNGTVTMHDPYAAYKNIIDEFIPTVKFEFGYTDQDELPVNVVALPIEQKLDQPASSSKKEMLKKEEPVRPQTVASIIQCWNSHKPESYSKIRTLSSKQLEAINKHLKNLGQKQSDVCDLIEYVCKGIERSDFWSNKIDQSGRNFSAVFGYGNPHDTKLKNVENLFILGQDDSEATNKSDTLNQEQKDLIRTYKYISFEYEKARNRNNEADIKRWQEELDTINQQLQSNNVFIESQQ